MLSERLYVKEDRKRAKVGDPPLEGMISFHGLDIMVENQKGTERQWGPKPDQKNHMYYDYGYVVGTMGWDGDEVDVYVGPNADSTNVFIVTQMKRPKFDQPDEEKVFLGFDTKEQVREAYLHQYNDPRFLGNIEHTTINVFKLRLALTGSTRKALKTLTISARIPNTSSVLPEKNKMNKSRAQAIDLLKNVGCPPDGDELEKDVTQKGMKETAGVAAAGAFEAAKPKLKEAGVAAIGGAAQALAKPKGAGAAKAMSAQMKDNADDDDKDKVPNGLDKDPKDAGSRKDDVKKALKSTAIAGIAKRQRMHAYSAAASQAQIHAANTEQPAVGTNRVRGPYEPPVVPVRRVETPFAVSPVAPDTLTDCGQCGYLHKSLDDCPRCAHVASIGGEALPIHFRGR